MARTKKSEVAAQDEHSLIPETDAVGIDSTDMAMEPATTEENQDLAELAIPSDDADAPLLLPEEVKDPGSSDGGNEVGDSDETAGYDWGPEEETVASENEGAESEMATNDILSDASQPQTEDMSAESTVALWGPETTEPLSEHEDVTASSEATPASPQKKAAAKKSRAATNPTTKPRRQASAPVLTIEKHSEVETEASREEILWHEIQNAARTRRILTGTLGGIERLENGKSVAVVYYKELRVIIPTKEMMLRLGGDNPGYGSMVERENKILGNMLGCDVDFVLKGIDSKTRSAVGSRSEAMLRKRKTFYMDTDAATGSPRIHEGRVVQARIIAVAAKVVRVEVFGVETSIMARDLSWEWIGDAHERFNVGDRILVRVNKIRAESIDEISIQADARSMTVNTVAENLQKCRVQGKYAGAVTDIHKGVVFIRLSIGVNAIAHSCLDSRMPAKRDEVSFVVTHIDSEQGVAVGLITRIIKQKI